MANICPPPVNGLQRCRQVIVPLLLMALLNACASVPLDYPKTPSSAIASDPETDLGAFYQSWHQTYGDQSGFVSLSDGNDVLGMRLKLIEGAQVSIDAQYFLIKPDTAAGLFIGKLLRAADRGVRVRLLIDDIFTPNLDSELSLFDSHPNVEVRLFNPVSRSGWKYWNYLANFKLANRRMHNKSFTVDSSATIVGGRNIADEYFQIKDNLEFLDTEVLGFGKVAEEVSETFDLFWNSSLALPISAFNAKPSNKDLDEWRVQIEREITGAGEGIYAKALSSELLQDIDAGKVRPIPARALVVTDDPNKLQHTAGAQEFQEVARELGQRFINAQKDILIITPYFVPQKEGLEFLREQRERGVRVRVVTNSLASTNHVSVHSGYARYRKRMLQMGIELYEVKPRPDTFDDTNPANDIARTLHTKLAIVDGKLIFVGSLNFDPRSIDINTEMGIFIDSTTLATTAEQIITEQLEKTTYKVMLSGNGSLKWVDRAGDKLQVLKKEPLSPWGRRFSADFYGILPIEGQL